MMMLSQATLVHYLPIATTLISAAFIAVLLTRASKRKWAPHLMWWAIGVFFYGVGTALESTIALFGNTPALNQSWYWAGAILGGYPLGIGSLYLLAPRKLAHTLTAISLLFVIFASAMVFMTPVDGAAIAEPATNHKPSGDYMEWQWVRLLTPFINIFAAVFLIGGAVYSTIRFAFPGRDASGQRQERNLRRAQGTALIAIGGLLPGIGGSMAKAGMVEALYVGEFVGLVLIWAGYEVCIRAPSPNARAREDAGTGVQPATA